MVLLTLCLLPSVAEAWGPLTHVYLANQLLDIGSALIPAGIYGLLKRFKNDFIYGNLSADIILGKRFQKIENSSHNWDFAWRVLSAAKNDMQRAFAYGYLTHLCADTVAHNINKPKMPFLHSILEIKSESLIERKYRYMLKMLDKPVQKRNDLFLQSVKGGLLLSFKTNKRLFKGFLILSVLPNYYPVSGFIDRRFTYEISTGDIQDFQNESLERMIELLKDGRDSKVLAKSPLRRPWRMVSLHHI
jgi:hypothetical protein